MKRRKIRDAESIQIGRTGKLGERSIRASKADLARPTLLALTVFEEAALLTNLTYC